MMKATLVHHLLSQFPDPDPLASIDGGQGATLLATAAAGGTEGHARVLAWLLTLAASPSGGLDLDARDLSAGKTALMVAAAEGNTNAVRSLLCAGADPRLTRSAVPVFNFLVAL